MTLGEDGKGTLVWSSLNEGVLPNSAKVVAAVAEATEPDTEPEAPMEPTAVVPTGGAETIEAQPAHDSTVARVSDEKDSVATADDGPILECPSGA